MIVQNMVDQNGNKVANQFIITFPENVKVFKSYDTVIAISNNGKFVLDSNALEYSATTTKYLKLFLGTNESKKQLQDRITSGFYQAVDLNN